MKKMKFEIFEKKARFAAVINILIYSGMIHKRIFGFIERNVFFTFIFSAVRV